MLPGRAPNQHERTCRAKVCRPSERARPARCRRQNLYKPHKCHRGNKELNFSKKEVSWSHAQHQPKRRAPQATSDRPPRARKRSERVFEDF
ncbi:BQ5605_C043g12105 [Microbotryum silenes-dioicae]|uniref:BQ5605_C043g12105 protein n=1 Tax=Microbotryum silenes-dioicae TaxID=796604 RepID=A0A2X0NC57_9BASI|nr:BQ5605_C043g12105 [Microbotryum silenes-dioicae]